MAKEALLVDQIRQIVETRLSLYPSAGATMAIARKGRLLTADAFGFQDLQGGQRMAPDAKLRLGSISKTYTAALTFQLAAKRKFDLTSRVWPIIAGDLSSREPKDPRVAAITRQTATGAPVGSFLPTC